MRRLVVPGVVSGVLWVGRGGRRCRVWGLMMAFPLVAARGGTGGGVCQRRLGVAGAGWGLRVVRQWPGRGGGRGGMVWRWHCWWQGGAGMGALLDGRLGVLPGRVGVACACRAGLRSLACRGVEVWFRGGCLGILVGLWSVGSGWLLVDGAFWHVLRVGGLPVVVGCSL